ncbi:DNA endonuclease [Actinidia chinensis var. chinensis]|uniref:DNA endonuclease n=1 Tax=Actinidia chinensis var. chinensis TaxID=1590841 RepID=A0A2R6RDJ7_ACTCC|nr:DNA endonuclease [Actinidia chinensis var. chinensis]
MWFAAFGSVCARKWMKWSILQRMNHVVFNSSSVVIIRRPMEWFVPCSSYSSQVAVSSDSDKDVRKVTLAKDLACLVDESSKLDERKPKTRVELKRLLELRIKKRVKEQYINGKFQALMHKVVANPKTLQDAYDCIRVNSNVDLASERDCIPFESLAEELSCGNFDVGANVFSISTRGAQKEVLVLPNVKLKVVQEAIRIGLEVVYKPHFSKISHGSRIGRGHISALKYICKEISNPDWWFTLLINKKLDSCILDKLISTMEVRIEDPNLYTLIRSMFDAQVLNLEFGGFPKGHGLPQEGVLSPILMNIYLDLFDRELYRMSMKYETLDMGFHNEQEDGSHSKLRSWFRRQMKGNNIEDNCVENSNVRIHCCRFMDEIFFAISGSRDLAFAFKSEIQSYLEDSLHLGVDNPEEILPCNGPHAVRFLGTLVTRSVRESPAVRAVHKLKEKVKLFASQKQESWDAGTVRIGKKWLAHGLKKVKESEIKHLADSNSLLSQISSYRKAGMETDHWYKVLLKVWMQDVNAKFANSDEFILSRYIAEPALPQELRDSFYEFQKRAEQYISSETASTIAFLPSSRSSSYTESVTTTEIIAPVKIIEQRLLRYGLTNAKGIPCTSRMLILQDSIQIIDWFTGIVSRWLRWYSLCQNFGEIKLVICSQLRKSCIRTLAAKYRIDETVIEKQFDSELSRIPSTQELELEVPNETLDSQASEYDDGLMYGISYSGSCLLSLARMVSQSRPCNCFVIGCMAAAPCVYTLLVMERQKPPGWKTGFSSCIHPSLNRRRIGLCKQHLQDLYLGRISLQSIDFGAWTRNISNKGSLEAAKRTTC